MAGSPPKPPPQTFAVGSSSPKRPPATFTGHPTYEELIDSYLRHRIVTGTKVSDFIHEADLYAADPDLLTSQYSAATADDAERTWSFFTTLRSRAPSSKHKKRKVDAGREGSWANNGPKTAVSSYRGGRRQRIGQHQTFAFFEKVDGERERSAWRMVELSLDSDDGAQEAGSSNLLVLCKVYRNPNANVDDESSMPVAEADGEGLAASAVATPGREGADEEIGAETAAGPGRNRKAGDKDSGAETVAASPGRQKKADGDGESADAATTGEIIADSEDPLDAAEKAEQEEPGVPRDIQFFNFFADSKDQLDAAEKAEQEEPGVPKDIQFFNFFGDDSSAPLDAPEEAEQEPRDPWDDPPFFDFFSDSQNPKKDDPPFFDFFSDSQNPKKG